GASQFGQLVVDRQGPEMVAGDPDEEVAAAQGLAHRLAAVAPPRLVLVERIEGELANPDVGGVGGGPRGDRLAPVVGEHFEQFVGQKGGAAGAAPTAEQIERKENDYCLDHSAHLS